jgi:predicted nucleic-acid-binding protein
MIGLDTNVLVRHLVQDEPAQAAAIAALFKKHSAEERAFYVDTVALCELAWVLQSAYEFDRDRIAQAIEQVLRTRQILVDAADVAWQALRDYREAQAGFADCLLARRAASAGCSTTMTFDRAAGQIETFTLMRPTRGL